MPMKSRNFRSAATALFFFANATASFWSHRSSPPLVGLTNCQDHAPNGDPPGLRPIYTGSRRPRPDAGSASPERCRSVLDLSLGLRAPRCRARQCGCRTTSSTGRTKILPSPMQPVFAALLDGLSTTSVIFPVRHDDPSSPWAEVHDVPGAPIQPGVALLTSGSPDPVTVSPRCRSRLWPPSLRRALERLDDVSSTFFHDACSSGGALSSADRRSWSSCSPTVVVRTASPRHRARRHARCWLRSRPENSRLRPSRVDPPRTSVTFEQMNA